jgi:phosphoribosylformimino-5-aminoimidazole carboxamide ribotide isomerase
MLLLPAIDLMSGQVVRLRQGKASEKTVYADDPVEFARRWQNEGGDYLHLVDLDAAFSGVSQNLDSIRRITEAITIPCELGGGMRSATALEAAFSAGVSRIIIGTAAVQSLDFVRAMVAQFGSARIAVGIDAKNGCVSVKGWTETSARAAIDLAQEVEQAGVGTIIYTDIATDGMMQGPNYPELEKIIAAVQCAVIASGGVATAEHVRRLAAIPRLHGCIIGKALYEGTVSLAELAALR